MSSQKKKLFFFKEAPSEHGRTQKIFFFLKLISKETLFPPKFDFRQVNADWLIT